MNTIGNVLPNDILQVWAQDFTIEYMTRDILDYLGIEGGLPAREEDFPPEVLKLQEFLEQPLDDSFGTNLSELKSNVAIGILFDIVTKDSVSQGSLRRAVLSIICVWVGHKISRMSTQQNVAEDVKKSAYLLVRSIKVAGGTDLTNTASLQQHDRTRFKAQLLTYPALPVSNHENHQPEGVEIPGDIEVFLPKSNSNTPRLRGFLENLKEITGNQDHLKTYKLFLDWVTQKINLGNQIDLTTKNNSKFGLTAKFVIDLKNLNIV
eukprot:snap_masked-scaffold_1-processed-gene-0.19-mRNA-1 protein AED:1.00 eAED:1.00 QI:0/-1/0/0/-1/1/1/0/263